MAVEHEPESETPAEAASGGSWTGHAGIDRRVLEMTRVIVAKIDPDPMLVRIGLENIERWTRQNGGYLPRCHAEWKEPIETHPWERFHEILLEESDEGQRLRSSHPFTGILTQDERDAIYARHGIDIPRMRSEYGRHRQDETSVKGTDPQPMSTVLTLHPERGSRRKLRQQLLAMEFEQSKHLWDWPKGSLHFFWFERAGYASFEGVEASIYPPSNEQQSELGRCEWALHTRTRGQPSPADIVKQNEVIRVVRQRFGGSFHNDWREQNRYIEVEKDKRDAVGRGIFLVHRSIEQEINLLKHAIPGPSIALKETTDLDLKHHVELIGRFDPTRVLYNALLPFAVAAFEHFFSSCFRILLQCEDDRERRHKWAQGSCRLTLTEIDEVSKGTRSVEDIVMGRYSFQNLHGVHNAFSEWFEIDVWRILRQRKKVGKRLPMLERSLQEVIERRHGVVHHFELDQDFGKEDVNAVLDLILTIMEVFVEHLERSQGRHIRDP